MESHFLECHFLKWLCCLVKQKYNYTYHIYTLFCSQFIYDLAIVTVLFLSHNAKGISDYVVALLCRCWHDAGGEGHNREFEKHLE